MEYYAHQTEDKSRRQTVKEHLENVSKLSGEFARPEFRELAQLCGMLHDLGKYCTEFVERLNGKNVKVEHSLAGAKVITEKYKNCLSSWIAAFCIVSHHSGLVDGGDATDSVEEPTLLGRLQRSVPAYDDYKNEIEIPRLMSNLELVNLFKNLQELSNDNNELMEVSAFITRYMYSCLVDADFLDTEQFYKSDVNRKFKDDFEKCRVDLLEHMSKFRQDTPIRKARNELLKEVIANIQEDAHIYLMNMPTGSGKTLCSIRAALDRMEKSKGTPYEKKRIIYVIPYASIVEQTAEIFEDIFKGQSILQHHSNYSYENKDGDDNDEIQKRLKLASENWDAEGIIVTTNVQFFESLYHHKSSRMRKIHNMADSIIVFDEVHMMPKNYLEPCIKGVGYITKYLNSEAIFLTATMPDFELMFKDLIPFCKTINLIEDRHEDIFKKCEYRYRGELSEEKLLMEIQEVKSALLVVNKRSKASEMYNKIKSCVNAKVYHLSTYMSGYDRSRIIDEVKDMLEKNRNSEKNGRKIEKIILVSTSLIEAGVDLDFQMTYRELSGLDSILQTGGRCNREGRYTDSVVNVFKFEDSNLRNEIAIKANITEGLFKDFKDITSQECIRQYYKIFYGNIEELKKQSITAIKPIHKIKNIPFREYSASFRLIESNTVGIAVPRDEKSVKLIEKLEKGRKSVARELQRYSATVYNYEFEEMCKLGIVADYGTGVFVLTNLDYYDKNLGLVIDKNNIYTE